MTTAVVLLVLPLAACSGGGKTSSAKPSTSNTWPGGLEPVEDEPTKAPERQKPFDVDEKWAWEVTGDQPATGTTVALGYRQPVSSVGVASEEVGQKGYVWGALELKVCVDTGSLQVSNTDWVLAYEDGARVETSSSTWDDFPKPEFPVEATVGAGDCVRGVSVFPVPGGGWPERAVYQPAGLDQPVEWRLPKR